VDEGAAAILDDSEAGDALAQLVEKLIFDQQKLKEMQQAALKLARPDAAGEIAREILEIANKQVSKP